MNKKSVDHAFKKILRLFLPIGLLALLGCGSDNDGSFAESCLDQDFCYIFISNSTSNGDFDALGDSDGNGIEEADTLCNNDSNKPRNSIYKALLSDGSNRRACSSANCTADGISEHIDWVYYEQTEYRRADGTTVIGTTNTVSLLENPLENAINNSSGSAKVWTGTGFNYTPEPSNCSSWTLDSSTTDGLTGETDSVNPDYLSFTFDTCDQVLPLYCVEQ